VTVKIGFVLDNRIPNIDKDKEQERIAIQLALVTWFGVQL